MAHERYGTAAEWLMVPFADATVRGCGVGEFIAAWAWCGECFSSRSRSRFHGRMPTWRGRVVSRAGFLRRSLLRQPRTLLRDKKIAVLDRLIEEYGDEGVATEK